MTRRTISTIFILLISVAVGLGVLSNLSRAEEDAGGAVKKWCANKQLREQSSSESCGDQDTACTGENNSGCGPELDDQQELEAINKWNQACSTHCKNFNHWDPDDIPRNSRGKICVREKGCAADEAEPSCTQEPNGPNFFQLMFVAKQCHCEKKNKPTQKEEQTFWN